jgi:DNA-directed RNA polymerase specialized sigma24 family protein
MLRKLLAPSQAPPSPRRSADAHDQSLMASIVARDLRAFEALYRIYHPRLARFLGLVTPRPTIIEEALNDTMLVVWRRAATYSGECKDAGPEQAAIRQQTQATLASALDTLSAEQRAVVVLTYFHDLAYAEIARIVDCPVDTVKTRMFHGRRRLRAALHGRLEASS